MSGSATGSVRTAAHQPAQPPPAQAISEDPTPRLDAMYRRIWDESMRGMPFVNPALAVEAIGFRRWQLSQPAPCSDGATPGDLNKATPDSQGDWVGAVVTPWFVNLFLLPGGGELWSDRRPGERCQVDFPAGAFEFIADHDGSAEIPAYQYCPLYAPPSRFASQAEARKAALDALAALFTAPPAPDVASRAPPAPVAPPADQPDLSRRAFFRRVAKI